MHRRHKVKSQKIIGYCNGDPMFKLGKLEATLITVGIACGLGAWCYIIYTIYRAIMP